MKLLSICICFISLSIAINAISRNSFQYFDYILKKTDLGTFRTVNRCPDPNFPNDSCVYSSPLIIAGIDQKYLTKPSPGNEFIEKDFLIIFKADVKLNNFATYTLSFGVNNLFKVLVYF